MTTTPPPAELNGVPYELAVVAVAAQPWFWLWVVPNGPVVAVSSQL